MLNLDPASSKILARATAERAGSYRKSGGIVAALGLLPGLLSLTLRGGRLDAYLDLLAFAGFVVTFLGFLMTVEGRYLHVIAALKQESGIGANGSTDSNE